MLSQFAMSQNVAIKGHITDAGTNEPLIGVNIVVKNTTIGTVSDIDGQYSIDVSNGQVLVFSFIGFVTEEIVVAGTANIDVHMVPDMKTLGEVVVTAEFGMKRVARTIGSSVQNVKAAEISESGRDNFISALQGRVAGMTVTSSGGAPGSSTSVVLRSITSISGNNQPLYVVDGIAMNNSTFNPVNLADGGAAFSVRNLDFSSRGNDFNPEDIESMTVLKGAAAAALYGSDASNGAIIITTKKGGVGKGKVTYSNMFRWDKSYDFPEIQNKYANGSYGTTNWYNTKHYGSLFPEGTKTYNNIDALMQTGFTSKHNISAEGGTEKISVRGSASFLDNTGTIKNTDLKRMTISFSGKAQITKWMSFESSMQYIKSSNNKAPRGTDGPLFKAMIWPNIDDMSNYLQEDGSHMRMPAYYTDTDLLNPLFGLYNNKFYDESSRFISSAAVNITPFRDAFIRAQAGWDVGAQTFQTSIHPYYFKNNAGAGTYNIAKSNFSDPTLNLLAGYNKELFNKFTVAIQVGYHQVENGVNRLASFGSNFLVADFQSINNCDAKTLSSKQTTTKRRVQAFSGQFELGYNNMAFVTLRGRNDWSSTLPVKNRTFFYPAIEGSFVLSELPFVKNINSITYLKLRGSVAQVGKDTDPLSIDPQLEATGLTGGGFKYGFTGPNPNLRPEITTSKEIGFEGRFFNDRLNVDFTHFWTECTDQIVKGFRLSYATGFVLNNLNVGSFDTWGWEAHVDGDVIRTANGFRWNVGVNASGTKSEVVGLPKNVTEYYDAYTWNSGNIRDGIMVGNPVTTLTGLAYTRNEAGDILISPTTGLPMKNSKWSVIGNREPKLRFGLTTSLSFKGIHLSAMFSGRYKASVVNGTKRTMMTYGTSWESVKLREQGPVVFNGVLADGNENTANPTKNTIAVNYTTYGASIYEGGDEDWIENDVNYLHLQELRLSYNIPSSWLQKILISNASVFVVGNDLITWTNYSGLDPVGNTVSAAAGGVGGEGYDVWALPSPRGLSVGLNITFK